MINNPTSHPLRCSAVGAMLQPKKKQDDLGYGMSGINAVTNAFYKDAPYIGFRHLAGYRIEMGKFSRKPSPAPSPFSGGGFRGQCMQTALSQNPWGGMAIFSQTVTTMESPQIDEVFFSGYHTIQS